MPDMTNSKRKCWSANQILGNVHKVLTSEKVKHVWFTYVVGTNGETLKDRQKSRLGGALFGTNEIFPPLQKLKCDLTKKHGNLYETCLMSWFLDADSFARCRRPQLYFIKTDIKAAFDSIKQDKMLEMLEDMLRQVCWIDTSDNSSNTDLYGTELWISRYTIQRSLAAGPYSLPRHFETIVQIEGNTYR